MDEEPNENLWVRNKGKAGTGDVIVGVCYRPPNQEDQAGIPSTDRSSLTFTSPGHHGRLQPPQYLLEGQHSTGHKQSRRFLEYVDDNFLL